MNPIKLVLLILFCVFVLPVLMLFSLPFIAFSTVMLLAVVVALFKWIVFGLMVYFGYKVLLSVWK